MKTASPRIQTILYGGSTVLLYAGLLSLAAVTLLVLVQIVCRNFFDMGLPGADELARFFGMALVFLAAPRLLVDNTHIAVDLVPNLLRPRARAILVGFNGFLTLVFCGIMLLALYKFLLRAGKFSTPALEIPNLIYYLPAVLGIAYFALVALYRLFRPQEAPPSKIGSQA